MQQLADSTDSPQNAENQNLQNKITLIRSLLKEIEMLTVI